MGLERVGHDLATEQLSIFACELTKDFLMFIFIGLFIYLATLGLSCGMWDLVP